VLDAYGDLRMSSLVVAYKEAAENAKVWENRKQAAKAELLTLVGSNEKVKGDDFSISCGMIGPATVSYERAAYRNFKIFTKGSNQ